MPRNITGGNRHKKAKNKVAKPDDNAHNTRVELAGENQIYAVVKSRAGGKRLLVECSDGQQRSAVIPGKFYKKVWMNVSDIVLCELKEGDINSCYVIYKYSQREANILKSQGHINFDIAEDADDKVGYKFTENTVSPQERTLDLNNIDDSMSSDDEIDETVPDKSHHDSEEAHSEDIDIDKL